LDEKTHDRNRAPLSEALRDKLLLKFQSEVKILHEQATPDAVAQEELQRRQALITRSQALAPLAETEETDGEGEQERITAIDRSRRERLFWKLHKRLNVEQSTPPDYHNACAMLGLDPNNPYLPQVPAEVGLSTDASAPRLRLKEWQVVGIAWMFHQENSPIGGGVVADDCGLGKTIQTLAFIVMKALLLPPNFAEHQPTLLAMPSAIIDTWLQEHSRYFSGSLRLWLSHRSIGNDLLRKGLNVSAQDLKKRLLALDRKDVLTSLTIVIVSYNAFPPIARTTLGAQSWSPQEKEKVLKVGFERAPDGGGRCPWAWFPRPIAHGHRSLGPLPVGIDLPLSPLL
jgi:SNF2 family DNA or RNA helicase